MDSKTSVNRRGGRLRPVDANGRPAAGDGISCLLTSFPFPCPPGESDRSSGGALVGPQPCAGNEADCACDRDLVRAASASGKTAVPSSSRPPACRPRRDGADVPDTVG